MSYPVSAPVTFVNSVSTDFVDFQATRGLNLVRNFAVTTAGDMLVRVPGGNNDLGRVPIGNEGQNLVVASGAPAWVSPPQGQASFCAYVTGSAAAIPTSRDAGAASGTWFTLGGNSAPGPFVAWSTSTPGLDPDSAFSTTAGVNYGIFTAPAAGVYEFSSAITFDSGVGVNTGVGLPVSSLPSGIGVRQMQIYNITTSTALATSTKQVEASTSNSTCLSVPSFKTSLAANDKIAVRVRHDRSGTNTVTVGATGISLPSQTFFSGQRIK